MEMSDIKQVVLTRKSTSPAPQYFLEITATDQVHGFPEVYRYTDLYHPDLSFMSLWLENQVQTLEQENAKRVILTFGDEITLKVEKLRFLSTGNGGTEGGVKTIEERLGEKSGAFLKVKEGFCPLEGEPKGS